MPAHPPPPLALLDLGRLPYPAALARQHEIHAQVLAGGPPTLILVEHDPVITISQRKTAHNHLLASPATLAQLGIDVQPTDRGGDITYHGPGQLVAYPILRLADYTLNIGRYMRLLEQTIIDTVAEFGLKARCQTGNPGVWIDPPIPNPKSEIRNQKSEILPLKLAAVGVRVQRGVTLHGLALNVATDLSHFNTIIPCGLPGRGVTSLQQLLGDKTPTMQQVKDTLAQVMSLHLTNRGREEAQAACPAAE